MRLQYIIPLTLLTFTAAEPFRPLSPFHAAIPLLDPLLGTLPYSTSNPDDNPTPTQTQDLFKRQATATSCPSAYSNCAGLGAPGLCCANTAICSADYAGHVACCNKGAACTGTIASIITGGTLGGTSNTGSATTTTGGFGGAALGGSTTVATSSTSQVAGGGLVMASSTAAATTSNGGLFIQSGSPATTLGSLGGRTRVVSLDEIMFVVAIMVLTRV